MTKPFSRTLFSWMGTTAFVVAGCSNPPSSERATPPERRLSPSLLEAIHRLPALEYTPAGSPIFPDSAQIMRSGSLAERVRFLIARIEPCGPQSLLPESADEQQLINPDGSYGPLVTLFPCSSIGGAGTPPLGSLVGAAQANGAYPTLNIVAGLNCVYVGNLASTRDVAYVTPPLASGLCKPVLTPSDMASAPTLELRRQWWGTAGTAAYPLTARFDWDPFHFGNYIGFRCGPNWCEAGPAGFASSAFDETSPYKTRAVKGWYDEQELASPTTATPSGVRAIAWPTEKLGDLGVTDFDAWTQTATARLSAELPEYAAKFLLHHSDTTAIYLCSSAQCRTEADAQVTGCTGDYRAKFVYQSTVKYRCVVRSDHDTDPLKSKIPGIVRWKWDASDELFWMRCGYGCCMIT